MDSVLISRKSGLFRIDDHELRPGPGPAADHHVHFLERLPLLGRISADDHDEISRRQVGLGCNADSRVAIDRAKGREGACCIGRGRGVHIVASHDIPRKGLDRIGLLVRERTSGDKPGIRAGFLECIGRCLEGLFPGDGNVLAPLFLHRRGDAVGRLQGIEAETADSAEVAVVFPGIHFHDPAVLPADDDAAAGTTGSADRLMLFEVPLPSVLPSVALHDRVHRAGLDTASAEGTVRFMKRSVEGRGDLRRDAAAHEVEDVRVLLLADPDAPAAEDAVIVVDGDEGAPVVQLIVETLPRVRRLTDAQVGGIPLQVTGPCLGTGHAVKGVEREDQVHDELADLLDRFGLGLDLHAFFHPRGAAGERGLHPLDLDHAHTAGADAPQFLDMAQIRDMDPDRLRGIDEGHALRDFCGLSIKLNIHHLARHNNLHGKITNFKLQIPNKFQTSISRF